MVYDNEKEFLKATLKDEIAWIDNANEKTNEPYDRGYIGLWEKNRKNMKEYFSIIFEVFTASDVAELVGCSTEFIKSTRRQTKRAPIPFKMFMKLFEIKKYLIVVMYEEPSEIF